MTVGGGGSLKAGIIGSLGGNIFPNLAGIEEDLASGIVNATTAKAVFIGNAMEELGRKVFAKFTVPLAIATAANIAQFQSLDREIRTVLTLFGTAPSLIEETFDEMRLGISQVSRDIGGLEKDIADGLYQAISAGVPRGGVFDFLNVAQMAAIADKTADLTTAVDGLTTVVNAFGLAATDVEQVSDVMFTTVALGKTTFGELSQSIGRVAPIAASAGVSFQELFAIIGATTLQGLQTSEAISFLRAGITGLLRPTDELKSIFEDVGFASAEAAIPVIGLQAAFQTVVDAAEGSTSRLQELIGTSEGVGVILGVTGENAKTFARILSGVDSSTGSTSRAFEIMDDSIGRTFGRMTEAFDRLGNTLGELGSQIVVPFVEVITRIASDLGESFRDLLPLAKSLGDIFRGIFEVFEIPVIRETVRAFASLVLTSTALIGVLGGLLFGLGAIIKNFAIFAFQLQVFKKLRKPVVASGVALRGWGDRAAEATVKGDKASKSALRLNTVHQKLGKSVRFLAGGFINQIGAMIAITAAIGILFNLYTKWREHTKELTESTQIFTVQLDKLLENAGLVNNAVTFEGFGVGEANVRSFINENIELIRQLRITKQLLGDEALRSQILAIGAQIIWKGNTPEETIEVVEDLATSVGIDIELDIEDLDDPTELIDFSTAGAESKVDEIIIAIERRFGAGFSRLGPAIDGQVQDLAGLVAEGLASAIQEGEGEKFLAFIREIETTLTTPGARKNFFTTLRDDFAELSGADLPFLKFPTDDLDHFLETMFVLAGIDIAGEIQLGKVANQIDEINEKRFLAGLTDDLPGIGDEIEDLGELTDEQQTKLSGLVDGLAASLQEGREKILAELDRISQGFLDQIPLFDLYEGATDIDFDEWVASQKLILEDMDKIGDFIESDKFLRLPKDVQDAFNAASIDDQTWLAVLGPEEFEEALGLLFDTVAGAERLGDIAGSSQIDEFAQQVHDDLVEQWGVMAVAAADGGALVESEFGDALSAAIINWPDIVAGALRAIDSQIRDHVFAKPNPISAPSITPGGPGFSPGGTLNYYNIESLETHDLPAEIVAANLISATGGITQ